MTKLIPILSGRCLVVELPSRPRYVILDGQGNRICYYTNKWDWIWQPTPRKSWRIIGMLSEVREGQAAGMVDKLQLTSYDQNGLVHYVIFRDYNHPHMLFKLATEYKETALESLDSAILAEGYLLESPPTPKCGCTGPAEEGVCNACDEWMESQSRVLDRSRCLLLGREI